MQFRARLKRISHFWREWRGCGRPSGHLSGVVFRFVEGGDYVSGVLTTDEMNTLRLTGHFTFEATAFAVPETPSLPETPPPEEPPKRRGRVQRQDPLLAQRRQST